MPQEHLSAILGPHMTPKWCPKIPKWPPNGTPNHIKSDLNSIPEALKNYPQNKQEISPQSLNESIDPSIKSIHSKIQSIRHMGSQSINPSSKPQASSLYDGLGGMREA